MKKPVHPLLQKGHPILLFDGVCNLCNGFVQTIIKIDKEGFFRFASLQSDEGKELLKHYQVPIKDLDTVVLITKDRYFLHSDVALQMGRMLGGFWQLFYVFSIIPKSIRDIIYNLIARNRYNWFGKKQECMIPTPELKDRFI